MRIFARLLVILISFSLLSGCASPWLQSPPKIRVVASFFPVAHFAHQIAGDHAEVISVIPSGLDPHDFDPTPKKLAAAYTSQLFVYNGAGLEPWADRIRSELESKGVKILKLSDQVEMFEGTSGKPTADPAKADPHLWLDPVSAQRQVELIRDAMIEVDPARADDYREHASVFLEKLRALDAEFKSGLSSCKNHTVILSHAAFQYLAHRYGFKMLSISGLSPQQEPSPKDFVGLVDQAKKLGLRYIFFEKRTNPKLAETLASEIKGETLDMFHIDGGFTPEEASNPNLYLDQMRANLGQLRKALNCR